MKLSIAIPDSCLEDESTLLGKSRKISLLARPCAIFRVKTIYIYDDRGKHGDHSLLFTMLKYLETPPFLRRRLFPKVTELKYSGVLHPLKIASHVAPSNPKKITTGDIREGVITINKGRHFVDIGINKLLPYFGKQTVGKRITIKFKSGYPDFTYTEIEKESLENYWGYSVKERKKLFGLLASWEGKVILTSRKGKIITNSTAKEYTNSDQETLVVFGSTNKGIHEILGNNIKKVQNTRIINFFPNQATETVRLEEAILGTLSILNSA